MPAEGFHRRPMNREHITVSGEPIGLLPMFLLVLLGVAVIEHLHLDAAQERHGGRGDGCAPDEHAGIPALAQMPPFDLEDEILVLPRRAQRARGPARAVDHSFAHAPGFRRAIRVHPPGEITSIEQRHEPVVIRRHDRRASRDQPRCQEESFHERSLGEAVWKCTQDAAANYASFQPLRYTRRMNESALRVLVAWSLAESQSIFWPARSATFLRWFASGSQP